MWGNSVDVTKSVIETIAPVLACIFNECIDCGVFPDLMKHSKVIPLYKSGSTSDPTNFRPISVLPTFSKIFEKIILDQIQVHFYRNKLLHSFFRYREAFHLRALRDLRDLRAGLYSQQRQTFHVLTYKKINIMFTFYGFYKNKYTNSFKLNNCNELTELMRDFCVRV